MSNDEIQPVDEISTSTKMDDWVLEIGARPNISYATRPSMDSNIEKYPSIFGKWQCWDDFGASFLTETQKWIFVACMTHCFGLNVRSYLEYMEDKVDLAWSYYDGVDEKFCAENRKRFIEHLLVNSCFLLFAMVLLSHGTDQFDKWYEIVDKNNYLGTGLTFRDIGTIIDIIGQDPGKTRLYMFTMNYQIPWFVVEVVYTEFSNLSKLFDTPTNKIAYFFAGMNLDSSNKIEGGGTVPEGGFKHLLHIFHWSRTHDGKYLVDTSGPTKVIGHFHIPSATELQLSQTVFRNIECGFTDVSYGDGRISRVMQLTPWYLSHYSTQLYESLLIFEDLYYLIGKRPFTAYVACMACMLKTEADVKVLQANGIIQNTTFDDKDVLCHIKKLRTFISGNLIMPNELVILEEKVMEHHKKSAYRVYGEFKKRYCSNTWIIISVIAGILLFVLTFIQTVLSFIQTKYSVLSYKKQ